MHGWTQKYLAERIGREPAFLSRVLSGQITSEPIWTQIRGFMADPKGYRPVKPKPILPVPSPVAIRRALAVLKRAAAENGG